MLHTSRNTENCILTNKKKRRRMKYWKLQLLSSFNQVEKKNLFRLVKNTREQLKTIQRVTRCIEGQKTNQPFFCRWMGMLEPEIHKILATYGSKIFPRGPSISLGSGAGPSKSKHSGIVSSCGTFSKTYLPLYYKEAASWTEISTTSKLLVWTKNIDTFKFLNEHLTERHKQALITQIILC